MVCLLGYCMDDLNDWSLGWDGMVLAYWKGTRTGNRRNRTAVNNSFPHLSDLFVFVYIMLVM